MPASWLPPWLVGTVLQWEATKPSSSSGQASTHSMRPDSPLSVPWPAKGSGVSVWRLPSVAPR